MSSLTANKIDGFKITFWAFVILAQVLMMLIGLLFSYYSILIFAILLVLFLMFIYPEFSYYLFVATFYFHLFTAVFIFAHTDSPPMFRATMVPFDDVTLAYIASEVIIILTLVSWLFARMTKNRPAYPGTSLDLPLCFFYIWLILSLYWTANLGSGLMKIYSLGCAMISFYLSVAIIRSKRILNNVLWILVFVGLVNAGVVAYSLHGEPYSRELFRCENLQINLSFIGMARERGMGFNYSQTTAMLLSFLIMIALGLLIAVKSKAQKVILALGILFMVYANLATLSKAGLYGLLAGLFFSIFAHKVLRNNFFKAIVVIAVVIILAYVLVYFSWPWPEKADFFRGRTSHAVRLRMWEVGFEGLFSTYGFGWGCGRFYIAHNLLFSFLFDLGIVGMFISIWIVVVIFRQIGKCIKKCTDDYYKSVLIGYCASIISIMVYGLVDDVYFDENLWAFLGIGMAITNLACGKGSSFNNAT